MKKANRIKKSEEFSKIIKKGKKRTNRSFVIYYLNKNETNPRVGISVGKKLGNAVERNKIKRQIRSMLRTINYDYVDFIVIARHNYKKNSYQKNEAYLVNLINEIEREFKKHENE